MKLHAIDAAVRRVLQLKARLGLFDDPYRRCGTPSAIAAKAAQGETQGPRLGGRPPLVGALEEQRSRLAASR